MGDRRRPATTISAASRHQKRKHYQERQTPLFANFEFARMVAQSFS